ncbi:LamG-like jellyroll fold domain-containing protein [Algibacter mikhailovii]|uniref:Laminin G domain-containing protein n=1 Tax=Algibacter mikhailovii TaxID=425498 RepID=A0A918R6C2_9FLAO|nr:LamG-like jellyroll fold domain-containing protein [Algibacter mikhailovii]GGZ87469.1 hypothetical protein GCM10007028_27070 [Algibacter mikhailovii]
MNTSRILVTLFIYLFVFQGVIAQDSWRFINIPDYHKSEGLSAESDEIRQERIKEQQEGFVDMFNQHGGELITIPGDIVSGHWYRKKFLKKFKSNPKFANYSTSQVVSEACKRSFGGLKQIIHDAGYKNLLVAVGDHEIGDNPWSKNSEVVKHIPTFRKEFASVFTKDNYGNSRFTKNIGSALPRPIGTIYEHTSNAYQYKNILFITLDMFRFDSKDKILGGQGVVTGDISGKHFDWLESVLKESQNLESINHIVVQSHLPIIYPVRKYASSGMLVDDSESEKILNLFRKYHVDLYLAGEVHMNTVTKDPKSDLIQFVGRGNDLSNLTTVDVEKDLLSLVTYHNNGDVLGSIVIDKRGNRTKIKGKGLLTPINPKGLQIHWSFDEVLNPKQYKSSVDGTFPKQGKHNPLMNQIKSPKAYLNDGAFNYDYSLIGEQVEIKDGIIGSAAKIDTKSKLFVLPIGPLDAGYERTIACWVKTNESGRQLIFNSGSFWSKKGQFFNLSLNEGNLELSLRPEIYTHTKGMKINDGNWHHLAIVLPEKHGALVDIQLFVDGKEIKENHTERAGTKIKTSQANWMSIATQVSTYKTDLYKVMGMKNYKGLLDDFCIWTRAFNEKYIMQLYLEGLKGVSALELEK